MAQTPQFEGSAVLERTLARLPQGAADLPIGELMVRVGFTFVDTPYVGWTLDQDPTIERCFITLNGLDCVTFAESSWGIARAIKRAKGTRITSGDVLREVTNTRYRGGKMNGYLSRLHYTSDWMQDNANRSNLKLVSASIPGSERLGKSLFFMSSHPTVYPAVKHDPSLAQGLVEIERRLPTAEMMFIPKAKVRDAEAHLQDGDMVGIVTNVAGLDTSHVGMIVRRGEKARFLHASSKKKKVYFDGRMSDYLASSASSTGLIVARPLEP